MERCKKRQENHESGVTLKSAIPKYPPVSEAQKSNFHKRKSSFSQEELLDDVSGCVRKKEKWEKRRKENCKHEEKENEKH